MNFIRYLNEEFFKYCNSREDTCAVYLNPTADDMKELIKGIRDDGNSRNIDVRVLIDVNNNNLYIWDANKAIHATIAKQISGLSANTVQLISGIRNNKILSQYNPVTINALPPQIKKYFTGQKEER